MKAQVLRSFGDPSNFELTDCPTPEVRPGTVLIRVAATSVNQIDLKILGGLPIGPDLPAVLGADVAGTVEKVGAGSLIFALATKSTAVRGGLKARKVHSQNTWLLMPACSLRNPGT